MTAPTPLEDQPEADPHEVEKGIIRNLWKQVGELRQQFDQGRVKQGLEPIQNKELAALAGIPKSTLSDLLTCKKYVVPEWERFGKIVECLEGTSKEWVPRWQKARIAHDGLRKKPNGKAARAPALSSAGTRALWHQRIPLPRRRRTLIQAGVIALAVIGLAVAGLIWLLADDPAPSLDPATQPAMDSSDTKCFRVKDGTQSVSVFTDPKGYDKWTEWPGRTMFKAEVDSTNPNRLRVLLRNGRYGYVHKDPRFIGSSQRC